VWISVGVIDGGGDVKSIQRGGFVTGVQGQESRTQCQRFFLDFALFDFAPCVNTRSTTKEKWWEICTVNMQKQGVSLEKRNVPGNHFAVLFVWAIDYTNGGRG